VAVDNEANLAAFAEFLYGAGRETTSMIYLKMSIGVGAGIVTEGRIMRGWHGIAGEVGHLSMDPAGAVCRCGNRGCLETLISTAHLLEQAAASHRGFGGPETPSTFEDLIASADRGDPASNRILQDAGRHIGRAIAAYCILINPECVVLGGQLGIQAGTLITAQVRESFESFAIKESAGPMCKIKISELKETAPAEGALAWGLLADTDQLTHPYTRLPRLP
jgi:predicted NBD/HSP70 family sugar kinase